MAAQPESLFLRKTSTSRLQLDALDGLRGVAVLIVVLSHLSNAYLYAVPWLDFRGTGKHGVYLFFVLSAFLLTGPLVRGDTDLPDARAWTRYVIRRVLRIFPLYWLVLLSNWAVTLWAPTPAMPSLTTDELVRHLLLQEGKGVYWTIPVEVSYYAVLPFVALAYRALRLDPALVTCATGVAIGGALLLWPPGESASDTLNVGYYLPIFLLGSYAAFLDAHWQPLRRASSRARAGVEAAAWIALLGVCAASPAVGSLLLAEELPKSWMHREFLLFGALWSAVVLGALNGRGGLERALSGRAVRLVGVVSFSVYLWHVPVARSIVLFGSGGALLLSWSTLLATLGVAVVSFVAIERPFTRSTRVRSWLARLGGKPA